MKSSATLARLGLGAKAVTKLQSVAAVGLGFSAKRKRSQSTAHIPRVQSSRGNEFDGETTWAVLSPVKPM